MSKPKDCATLSLRPYQAMCIVCAFGEDDAGPKDTKLREILDSVRNEPDRPVALCCRSDDQFAWQNPGNQDDTPEGAEYNMKRDMDILLRMDLAPGSILPARILFRRLLKAIPTAKGICGGDEAASDAWRGCAKAKSDFYEKGHKKGIEAIIPPRDKEQMARDKEKSLAAMMEADAIRIRPHILVCAVAQYGNGIRPPFAPDNLPEMIQHFLKNPNARVTLATGADWMMCAPCPSRVDKWNACVCGAIGSGGLYNEMKDLNVLQRLGLTFGATLTARGIYKLIFERIPKVDGVCALNHDIADLSVWRDGCGRKENPCPGYAKGRAALVAELT